MPCGPVGAYLGYRKGKRAGVWVARRYVKAGYQAIRIGMADDLVDADNPKATEAADDAVVLTFQQAWARASKFAKGELVEAPRYHADGPTLNDAFAYYLAHPPTDATESSLLLARRTWNRHIRTQIGGKRIANVRADDYRTWRDALAKKPPTNRGRVMPFDPKDPDQVRKRRVSANRAVNVLKAALNLAWKNDQIPGAAGEWRKLERFKIEDTEPRMMGMDEVRRLLNAAAPDFRKLLTGAMLTGCRYGELCALQVRSYDPHNRTVAVYQFKTGKRMHQPLTAEGVAFFEGITVGRSADEPLFQRADGRPWGPGDQQRPMREAAKAANVVGASFKSTRASYGKALLDATRDIEMVAAALGHSDSRITRKHYARYLQDDKARAIATMPAIGITTDAKVRRIKVRP